MTVVETDGDTHVQNPFNTSFLMPTPRQTCNVLITENQPQGEYHVAMAPICLPIGKINPFLCYSQLCQAIEVQLSSPKILFWKVNYGSIVHHRPISAGVNDSVSVQAFTNQVKKLYMQMNIDIVDELMCLWKLAIGLMCSVASCGSSDVKGQVGEFSPLLLIM